MAKKRRTERTPLHSARNSDRNRDHDTIRLANELLAKNDVVALRKLAAIRGLVSHGLRSRVWPLLLGIQDQTHDEKEYALRRETPHKDSTVVDCDMVRSLWTWTQGWTDEARDEKRAALKRILDATVAGNADDLHYYQGLHDVASVLLFVCGEVSAYRMLSRLASCHLRDCTRPTLDAVTESLSLLYPILQAADPELHAYITALSEPSLEVPYFALSWHMTWFSHDVTSLDQCARLFDLFISSHPLMPLYLAVVAVREQRDMILGCGPDAGDVVYSKLKGLVILGEGQLTADELAQQAAALYRASPPAHLVRQLGSALQHSSALFAYRDAGRWHVPETPGKRKKRIAELSLRSLPLLQLTSVAGRYLSRTPRSGISGGADSSSIQNNSPSSSGSMSSRGRGLVKKDSHLQQNNKNNEGGGVVTPVKALTAMVFTGIAGAAFIGTTLVLSQLQLMGRLGASGG